MFLAEDAHDALFTAATLRLGEVHWYLLKAAQLMVEATTVPRKAEGGLSAFTERECTAFGQEVGQDQIHWWIWKRERNISELQAKTERALGAAQTLQKASLALKAGRPESYESLISTMRQFADSHGAEIETLHEYVRWLHTRDTLAPSTLFTYRVWGSTRRGDRWVDLYARTLEAEKPEMVRRLTETVLGLHTHGLYAFDRAWLETEEDIANGVDPEERAGVEIEPPIDWVMARASAAAYDECAIYFAEIRDSLRNVLLDIEKFIEQGNLMHSDAFWREFIGKAIRTKRSESQLWDFKETLTLWRVLEAREKEKARVTFAEDIASLANTHGGVLIVGVTDQPREIVGIGKGRELENRLKVARLAIDRHIEYEREIVSFHQAVLPDSGNVERVCLVVIVAQASGAVGVHDGHGSYTYPVRRETGIERKARIDLLMGRHVKSDNHDFLRHLSQFTHEN